MRVVAEDDDFLYLAKPSGQHVFGRSEPGLDDALVAERPEQARPAWPDGFAAGILHRLDGWTSGLVIAARSLEALSWGRSAFETHRLTKRYRFLTSRDVDWSSHVVEHALGHDKRRRARMVWRRGSATPHRGSWLDARTTLKRVGRRGALHLWEASMSTGVMHQVRVHAASAGLALHGDRLYGGGGDGRFFLHHRTIEGWLHPAPDLPEPEDWPT